LILELIIPSMLISAISHWSLLVEDKVIGIVRGFSFMSKKM